MTGIRLNEIDMDTLLGYMDPSKFRTDSTGKSPMSRHVALMRDYAYNLNNRGLAALIDANVTIGEDYVPFPILCVYPTYTKAGETSLDPAICKMVFKTKIKINRTAAYTRISALPTGYDIAVPEYASLPSTQMEPIYAVVDILDIDDIPVRYSDDPLEAFGLLRGASNNIPYFYRKNKITFTRSDVIRCRDETQKVSLSSYIKSDAEILGQVFKRTFKPTLIRYMDRIIKVGSNYYNVIVTPTIDNKITTFSLLDTANVTKITKQGILDLYGVEVNGKTPYLYVDSYYSLRGALLNPKDDEKEQDRLFVENLINCYENRTSMADLMNISIYNNDYLSNAYMCISGLQKLYTNENRIDESFVSSKASTIDLSECEYQQIILEEVSNSSSEASNGSLTLSELRDCLKQAKANNPYERLVEYERFSTIDERFRYLTEEKLKTKRTLSVMNTPQPVVIPKDNIIHKSEFKDNMIKAYMDLMYGNDTKAIHDSYERFYYDKINSAALADRVIEGQKNIKVFTLYHDSEHKTYNDNALKAIATLLATKEWRIKDER